jgi:hypothetical protein
MIFQPPSFAYPGYEVMVVSRPVKFELSYLPITTSFSWRARDTYGAHYCCKRWDALNPCADWDVGTVRSLRQAQAGADAILAACSWQIAKPQIAEILRKSYKIQCLCVFCSLEWTYDNHRIGVEHPFGNGLHRIFTLPITHSGFCWQRSGL